ncbi:hypothetical protein D1007_48904 [Hordeum vulgare]|nr:hypothetical protein D1007_48904 [Hordeum vulgare]
MASPPPVYPAAVADLPWLGRSTPPLSSMIYPSIVSAALLLRPCCSVNSLPPFFNLTVACRRRGRQSTPPPVFVHHPHPFLHPNSPLSIIPALQIYGLSIGKEEWLFNLLDEAQASVRSRIIMVLWCFWYVRNEIVHGKTPPPQDVSSAFLQSYHNTFSQISSSVEDIIKGKSPVVPIQSSPPCKAAPRLPWPRPPEGMVALSVDGSYATSDGSAGTGMILRKPSGDVIFAAYRKLFHCNDALEAELQAIHEGVKLAAERSEATIMLQSDCVTAINAITGVSLDFSAYGHMIREI